MYYERPYLEKGSRTYICPNCGHKELKRYIQYGKYIHDTVGRCNRQDKCLYHKKPAQWFSEHPTERMQCKPIYQQPTKKNVPKEEPKPISYIPLRYIFESAETRNSDFVFFLFSLFDWATIKRAIDPYFIGCTKDGAVVFPQIDEQGDCRTAKVQSYDRETGKRKGVYLYHGDKNIKPYLANPYNLQMCLFGLHLIRSKNNTGKTVCICESEKSAVIAAGCMPDYIWMAAGALDWLNVDKLKPLRGWNVVLFPDTSKTGIAFEKWAKVADEANRQGLFVSVSTMLEVGCTVEEKAKGYDLGDYLIDRIVRPIQADESKAIQSEPKDVGQLTETPIVSTALAEMISINPTLATLMDRLGLVEV